MCELTCIAIVLAIAVSGAIAAARARHPRRAPCPDCGQPLEAFAAICPHCGSVFRKD